MNWKKLWQTLDSHVQVCTVLVVLLTTVWIQTNKVFCHSIEYYGINDDRLCTDNVYSTRMAVQWSLWLDRPVLLFCQIK
jgi:hypothetical protein